MSGMIDGRSLHVIGNPKQCDWLILQPADMEETEMVEQEAAYLKKACADIRFSMAAFTVDWWRELTPWPEKSPYKGQPDFGEGAPSLLNEVTGQLIPSLIPESGRQPLLLLAGYSLAGLFALWAGCQTDRFDGITAASPSLWYPGWAEYAKAHPCQAKAVYLSLGDREAKTRNPLMSTVEDAIRTEYVILERQHINSVLEWNPGNHFQEPAVRTAKGIKWIMETRFHDH